MHPTATTTVRARLQCHMQVPLWLKIGRTVWLLVWEPAFWKYYAAQNFLYF